MGICEKCQGQTEMYGVTWCPRCDKPETKPLRALNIHKCLRHVELTKNLLTEEEAWERHQQLDIAPSRALWVFLCDHDYVSNDAYVSISFPDMYHDLLLDQDRDDFPDSHERAGEMMKYLIEVFDLESEDMKNVVWEMS